MKCYVIETDHPHVEYQKTLLICKTRQIAEDYLPFVQRQVNYDCETTLDIPLRITEKLFIDDKRKMDTCLRYTGNPKCHYTDEYCNDEYVQSCKDYKSDRGTYLCPHCKRQGLKLFDYGKDKVWECLRCGAELWYCESVDEMLQRCEEIRKKSWNDEMF